MLSHSYPILYWRWLKKWADNSIVSTYANGAVYTNVFEYSDEAKVSQDSGSFVPGEFRVNAYEHGRASSECRASGVVHTRKSVSTVYYYEYKFTGKLALIPQTTWYMWSRPTTADLQVDTDTALQRAFSKVGQSIWAGGQDLGEISQTLQMLRSPLKSLRTFFLKDGMKNLRLLRSCLRYRRFPNKVLADGGKSVADTWLEIRYGLMPLVYSIQDLIQVVMLKADALDPNRIRTVRSKYSTVRTTAGRKTGGSALQLQVEGAYEAKHDIKIVSIVYYKQHRGLSMSRKLGLDLASLPETAWELTKLSFVVDWLFTIGPWLSSIRYNPDFEILGSTSSIKVSSSGSCTPIRALGSEVGPIVVDIDLGQPITYTSEWFNRIVSTKQPPVLPQFRGLADLNFSRTVDSLALILQAFLPKLR